MDIYNYDGATGAYLGKGQADVDPLNQEEWILPAFATTVAPPADSSGNVRVFRDGAWGYVLEQQPDLPPQTEPVAPVSVSARQFKLQLLAAGFLDQVDAWVKTQGRAVQIAYEYSGSFVRTEPMMTAGFTALGFTDAEIDAFFTAASKL